MTSIADHFSWFVDTRPDAPSLTPATGVPLPRAKTLQKRPVSPADLLEQVQIPERVMIKVDREQLKPDNAGVLAQ